MKIYTVQLGIEYKLCSKWKKKSLTTILDFEGIEKNKNVMFSLLVKLETIQEMKLFRVYLGKRKIRNYLFWYEKNFYNTNIKFYIIKVLKGKTIEINSFILFFPSSNIFDWFRNYYYQLKGFEDNYRVIV